MTEPYNILWKNIENCPGCTLPKMPEKKIITKTSKVCAMGSCFADEMGWCLRDHGVDMGDHGEVEQLKHLLYQWGTFFDPKNLYDCLDRLINNSWEIKDRHFAYIPEEDVYYYLFMKIRANSNNIDIVKKRLFEVEDYWRNWLAQSDIVILTLGMIETWIDKDNDRAWQGFVGTTKPVHSYENRAYHKTLTYEECLEYVQKCIELVNGYGRKKNVIITVSPVPLASTFRKQDVITANRHSKSILRVVAETVTQLYDNITYFPAFEIVTDCVGWPQAYKTDKRHVRIGIFAQYIAPTFLKYFYN
ncbi:MAG: GSCFA domain-containing protein [Desulfobacteraceae bacterium]|nr:GSCFA domain-containing protein [Desulfobacteraceae bacterium]